jgi:hypothetical protein
MGPVGLLEWLADLPGGATVREVRKAVGLHWHSGCRHCGQVIVNFCGEHGFEDGAPWYHSTGSRGCRAASADGNAAGVPLDESLDRRWTAAPGGSASEQAYDSCHACRLLVRSDG